MKKLWYFVLFELVAKFCFGTIWRPSKVRHTECLHWLKLGLHVDLVTRGNEAAAAGVLFARLHCTQENPVTHEWGLLLPGQCHPTGVKPLELLQAFSKATEIAIIVGSAADFHNRHFKGCASLKLHMFCCRLISK